MLVIVNNTNKPDLAQTRATRRLIEIIQEANLSFMLLSTVDQLELVMGRSDIQGILLSGSDLRLTDPICPELLSLTNTILANCRVPVLGICFGHQLLAALFGGRVSKLARLRAGYHHVEVNHANPLVGTGDYVQYNNDYVERAPFGWQVLARTGPVIEVMRHSHRPVYGVQFHPELSGPQGKQVLHNFFHLCQTLSGADHT